MANVKQDDKTVEESVGVDVAWKKSRGSKGLPYFLGSRRGEQKRNLAYLFNGAMQLLFLLTRIGDLRGYAGDQSQIPQAALIMIVMTLGSQAFAFYQIVDSDKISGPKDFVLFALYLVAAVSSGLFLVIPVMMRAENPWEVHGLYAAAIFASSICVIMTAGRAALDLCFYVGAKWKKYKKQMEASQ